MITPCVPNDMLITRCIQHLFRQIDWQPDSLTFLVDGNVTRTILAADTVNNVTGVTEFPNTPSRIQLR